MLGDIPILAELTAQVAAGRAEGEHARAGVEVVKRLLLDRVNAEVGGAPIAGQDDAAILSLADEAESALPLPQPTGGWTEVALDPLVLGLVPPLHDTGRNDDTFVHRCLRPDKI